VSNAADCNVCALSRFIYRDKERSQGIVETLLDVNFAALARGYAQSQLWRKHKFVLGPLSMGGEMPIALPVDVLGMGAFERLDPQTRLRQVQNDRGTPPRDRDNTLKIDSTSVVLA